MIKKVLFLSCAMLQIIHASEPDQPEGEYIGINIHNTVVACILTDLYAKNTTSPTLLHNVRDLNREFARVILRHPIPNDYVFPGRITLSTNDIRPKQEVLSNLTSLHPRLIHFAKIVTELTPLPIPNPQTTIEEDINWHFERLKRYIEAPFPDRE